MSTTANHLAICNDNNQKAQDATQSADTYEGRNMHLYSHSYCKAIRLLLSQQLETEDSAL